LIKSFSQLTLMKDKICLITGASSGIGKVTAIALAKMGAEVLVVCRNLSQAEKLVQEIKMVSGNESTDFFVADLADLASIKQLAEDFKARFNRLDILINNAGILQTFRSETKERLESHFGVNYLAHFLLTELLLENLKKSPAARIINVSSDAHAWAKLDFDNLSLKRGFTMMRAYGNSKLAQLYFTYELARRLKETNITVNALHPGVVSTGIARHNVFTDFFFNGLGKPFLLTPEQGAETSIYLASSPEVAGVSGKYFYKKKSLNSSDESYDTKKAAKMWQISEDLLKDFLVLNEKS
jgi:NAD(P)-dependent dehydrogenase (short-subunit alcohol dehydrogenase family)